MSRVDRSRLPPIGPDPAFRFPAFERRHLSNGLALWTVQHRGRPVCTFLLLVPGGATLNPAERPGLAALAADMLDEGAGGRSSIEIQEALAGLGARFDTEVGPDSVLLSLTTLSRLAADALGIVCDVVATPTFERREFERVRDLRVNRLTQLREVPSALADRAFMRALYGSHPYGHLPFGTEEAVAAASLEDVTALYHRGYRPASSTLVACGDLSHDELVRLAEATFGRWREPAGASRQLAPSATPADASLDQPQLDGPLILDRPGAAQSELRIGHVGVDRRTPDYHALVVLNAILGGQFTSRLNLKLREEKGFTYGVRTAFDCRRQRGPFIMQTAVQTRATAEAIDDARHEIDAIRGSRPATPAELDLAQASLTRGYPRNFETAEQIARALIQVVLYDLPHDYFDRFVPTVNAVTASEVTRAAAMHIDPARAVTVIVGDRSAIDGAKRELRTTQ